MATREDERETIKGHVDYVIDECGAWPEDPPSEEACGENFADVLAAWSYVSGWANALNMTARELFDSLDLNVPWPEDE
jgi:hypothetical protein